MLLLLSFLLLDFLGFDIGGWLASSGAIVLSGMVVTILRKKGYIKGVKLFSRKIAQVTQEIGEAFLETSDVFEKIDEAIKENGRLKENCVRDVISEGKEAMVEWKDVIVIIKPNPKAK